MDDEEYIYRDLRGDYLIIKTSRLFDYEWYSNEYDVDEVDDLIMHFLKFGCKNNYNPNSNFNMEWYLKKYGDVKTANMNPFVHFIKYGKDEGRFPVPFFHDSQYMGDYYIILNSGLFDKEWFCEEYSIADDVDPIYYYLVNGVNSGLNPSQDFNTLWYLREYGDVKTANMNPFAHYVKYGRYEGKLPKLYDFDEIPRLNLVKTIKGKNNYLFLINDTNHELKQHFDINYVNQFKFNDFTRDYFFKKYLFEKKDIGYFYFIIPDKSVVCKDLIPINKTTFKRNINKIKFVPDFSEYLDESCYWKNDSHLSYKGSQILSYHFLNYLDNSFSIQDFQNLIDDCDFEECSDPSDLLHLVNWSYPIEEKTNFEIFTLEYPIPKNVSNLIIPEKFIVSYNSRKSEYFYNPNSFSNLRVLIFRDSSTENMKYFLTLYFREVFIYWDYMHLNDELIKWFNPDMVLEIRIERFMDGYLTPVCLKEKMWW